MKNKLGFSTGKGFLKKVDKSINAEKTDFTNAEWKPLSLEQDNTRTMFYEGRSYQVQFDYNDATWIFTFSVPACTTNTIWVGYLKSTEEIKICLTGLYTDNMQEVGSDVIISKNFRYLDGSIGSEYSLYDNITNGKYRELN